MAKFSVSEDLGELKDFIRSPAIRKVLAERKNYAQEEANRFVREQKLIEAYAAVKRMDDIDKLVEIVEKKITDTEKEMKNAKP